MTDSRNFRLPDKPPHAMFFAESRRCFQPHAKMLPFAADARRLDDDEHDDETCRDDTCDANESAAAQSQARQSS
jgi:hypothetical protein